MSVTTGEMLTRLTNVAKDGAKANVEKKKATYLMLYRLVSQTTTHMRLHSSWKAKEPSIQKPCYKEKGTLIPCLWMTSTSL